MARLAIVSERTHRLATAAYEELAPYYDAYMADCQYGVWLDQIEEWALAHGLRGRRLLDVACGTGKSFEPMLHKGYDVTACDLSPPMVAEARKRAESAATVLVADMRQLPWVAGFDLITCIDDAMNYLLDERDLLGALASMCRALRPGGILVFDTNSLGTYRRTFVESHETVAGGSRFCWHGESTADFEPGELASATLEVRNGACRTLSRHVQRHWPVASLRAACTAVGLERISFRGQMPGCRLLGDPDEELHSKVLCLAAKPTPGEVHRDREGLAARAFQPLEPL